MQLNVSIKAIVYNVVMEEFENSKKEKVPYYRAIIAQGSECLTISVSEKIKDMIKIGVENELAAVFDSETKKIRVVGVGVGSIRPTAPINNSSSK